MNTVTIDEEVKKPSITQWRVARADGEVHEYKSQNMAMEQYYKHGAPIDFEGVHILPPHHILVDGGVVNNTPVKVKVVGKTKDKKGVPDKENTAPVSVVLRTPTGEVSEVALERINRHKKYLDGLLLTTAPTIYAPGSVVNSTGVANFALSRDDWENSAPVESIVSDIRRSVLAEKREDPTLLLGEVTMDADGYLHGGDLGGARLEEQGFKQFIGRLSTLFPGGPKTYLNMDSDQRVAIINRHLKRDADKAWTFRVRTNPDTKERTCYSLVTPKYTTHDINILCENLLVALQGQGLRGEGYYDPRTTRFKLQGWWHANRGIEDLAAGDVFKAGVTITSADNGQGGIYVWANIIRNLCLNLIILGQGKVPLLYAKHKGNKDTLGEDIRKATARAVEMFAPFLEEWKVLRETPTEQAFGGKGMAEVWNEVSGMADFGIGNTEVTEAALAASFLKEPGDSMADVLNAVSRMWDLPMVDEFQREKVEVGASIVQAKLKAMAMPL